MSQSTGDIKRRIRSIGGTRKITKAMELVSSVKMRKASAAVLANRPYTDQAWDLLLNLAQRTDPAGHALLRQTTPARSVALIVVASNRGFVGPLNSQLLSTVNQYLTGLVADQAQSSLILLGTKGRALSFNHGHEILAEFIKDDVIHQVSQIRPIAKLAIEGFRAGEYDRVMVAFVDYISSLSQKPRLKQVLPLTSPLSHGGAHQIDERHRQREYLFEPNPDDVLETLLPKLVEMQIFRAVLESNASEHAARMIAMRSASDSAGELIDDLTLTFNQVRQAAITQDLSEISASRAALEG
jgi:F-type H+-transporting ATPase subunit gamma